MITERSILKTKLESIVASDKVSTQKQRRREKGEGGGGGEGEGIESIKGGIKRGGKRTREELGRFKF